MDKNLLLAKTGQMKRILQFRQHFDPLRVRVPERESIDTPDLKDLK